MVRKGWSARQAMVEVGYSEKQARKGLPTMLKRKAIGTAFEKEMAKISTEANAVPGAAERAALVRWRLTKNIISGQDKSVASLKLAGMDRELNLYQPEHQSNMILVNLASLGEFEEK
jgi:hypothetical protein